MVTDVLIDKLEPVRPSQVGDVLYSLQQQQGAKAGPKSIYVGCPSAEYKATGFHGAANSENVVTVGVYCNMFGVSNVTDNIDGR